MRITISILSGPNTDFHALDVIYFEGGWCAFHRIYRLALPLRAPEMLSSLSKSRINLGTCLGSKHTTYCRR